MERFIPKQLWTRQSWQLPKRHSPRRSQRPIHALPWCSKSSLRITSQMLSSKCSGYLRPCWHGQHISETNCKRITTSPLKTSRGRANSRQVNSQSLMKQFWQRSWIASRLSKVTRRSHAFPPSIKDMMLCSTKCREVLTIFQVKYILASRSKLNLTKSKKTSWKANWIKWPKRTEEQRVSWETPKHQQRWWCWNLQCTTTR